MSVRYIRKSGSDSNGGTSPSDAWLTIGKALGASGLSSGDTCYVGAGTYRESVTVAMTSATAETSIVADTSGAFTGDAGEVIWTAYTTNDATSPASAATLILSGRDFLTFDGFTIIGGSANPSCVSATTATSTDITFRNCALIPGDQTRITVSMTNAAGVAFNWTFDRCLVSVGSNAAGISLTAATTSAGAADYDLNVQIKNCLIIGGGNPLVGIQASGTLTFKPGGVDILNSTLVGGPQGFRTLTATHLSTTVPCTIYNSIILASSVGLNAATSGQIIEDYNYLPLTTPRTNVSAGANSIADASRAPLLDFGQSWLHGFLTRAFLTPLSGSPLLGFGNQSGAPSVDAWNRPRPAGGASVSNALGYLERHDTAAKEISIVQSGSTAIKLTGPADQDLLIPVDATATTITLYGRYDTNHGATNKPQAMILGGGEIGVSTQTVTMTAAVDTWENLVFSSFTPTAGGFITLRLISRAAAGSGIAYFDTVSVA